MEDLCAPIVGPQMNENLIKEAQRIFSILTMQEQRSLLLSFSQMASSKTKTDTGFGVTVDQLTQREKQVLILVARGYTRREIGQTLGISANTAARHIANIYRKIDISTAAEAVKTAIDAGLIT